MTWPDSSGAGVAPVGLAVELDPCACDCAAAQAHFQGRRGDAHPVQPRPTVDESNRSEAIGHLTAGRAGEVAVEEGAECRVVGRERRAVVPDQEPVRALLTSRAAGQVKLEDKRRPREHDRIEAGALGLCCHDSCPDSTGSVTARFPSGRTCAS